MVGVAWGLYPFAVRVHDGSPSTHSSHLGGTQRWDPPRCDETNDIPRLGQRVGGTRRQGFETVECVTLLDVLLDAGVPRMSDQPPPFYGCRSSRGLRGTSDDNEGRKGTVGGKI